MSVKSALASLWNAQFSIAPKDFLCSAFFVADGWLLTAAHALNGQEIWVRPHADGTSSYKARDTEKHPDGLDIALIRIDTMPAGVTVADLYSTPRQPAEMQLHGYYTGRHHNPIETTLLAFDDAKRHYRMSEKQPVGYSGGPIATGSRAWAVSTCHYGDANTHIGCAVAVHQFIDWLRQTLQNVTVSVSRPAAAPGWDVWAAEAQAGIVEAFDSPVFEPFATVLDRQPRVPKVLLKAFDQRDRLTLGESAVDGVLSLAQKCRKFIKEGRVSVSPGQREVMADEFRNAMDWAIRVCIDPFQLASLGYAFSDLTPITIRVPAASSVAAGLAVRPSPLKSLRSDESAGDHGIRDCNLIESGIESGEGDDALRATDHAIWKHHLPQRQAPPQFDAKSYKLLQGKSASAAKEGKSCYLLLPEGMSPEMTDKISERATSLLGVHVMCVVPPDDSEPLFLFDSDFLLPRLNEFLAELLKPEWTHQ